MKKILAIILSLTFVFAFAACDGWETGVYFEGYDEMVTDTEMWVTYDKLDGEETYDIEVPAACDATLQVETNQGNVSMSITKVGEETPIYDQDITAEIKSIVTFSEAGSYKVKLTADDHAGSVKLIWGE